MTTEEYLEMLRKLADRDKRRRAKGQIPPDDEQPTVTVDEGHYRLS